MPARSKSQQKKLFVLERQGKLKPGVAEEFAVSGAAYRKLPEHVPTRRKVKKK